MIILQPKAAFLKNIERLFVFACDSPRCTSKYNRQLQEKCRLNRPRFVRVVPSARCSPFSRRSLFSTVSGASGFPPLIVKIAANAIIAQNSSATRIDRWLRELIVKDSSAAAAVDGKSTASNEIRATSEVAADTSSCFVQSGSNV